jgi:hypothetical protein
MNDCIKCSSASFPSSALARIHKLKANTHEGLRFFLGTYVFSITAVKLFVYEFVTLNSAAFSLTVWMQYFNLLCVWLCYP